MPGPSSIRTAKAHVELWADNSKLVRGLRLARAKLKAFAASIKTLGRNMALPAITLALPIAGAMAIFAKFDSEMRKVRAVTGAANDEFKEMRDLAKELGRTKSFKASEVASGQVELGRAGFDPTEILQSTEAVMDLARGAGEGDIATSTAIAASALRAFQLEASDMTRVADVLTATANNSAQSLADIGEAMKDAAPAAKDAGGSIEETAAVLGILANNGIKGSKAGNAVQRAYKNIAKTSIQKKLQSIGVSAVDAEGNMRSLPGILSDIGRATEHMGSARRLALLDEFFGRASGGASILSKSDFVFDDLLGTIQDSSGAAKETADVMDSGIEGAFNRLMSAVEGVALELGEALVPVLDKVTGWLTEASGWVSKFIDRNKSLVSTIATVIATVGGLGVGLTGVGIAVSMIATGIGGLALLAKGALLTLATIIGVVGGSISFLLSPIGLVVAGVTALGAYLVSASGVGGKAIEWLGEKFQSFRNTFSATWSAVVAAVSAGDLQAAFGVVTAALNFAWVNMTDGILRLWAAFKAALVADVEQAVSDVASAWAWLMESMFGNADAGIGGIMSAFRAATKTFSTWWTKFVEFMQNSWTSVTRSMAATAIRIRGVFDSDLDVNAALKKLKQTRNAESPLFSAPRKSKKSLELKRELFEITKRQEKAQKKFRDAVDAALRSATLREAEKNVADAKAEDDKQKNEQGETVKKAVSGGNAAAAQAAISVDSREGFRALAKATGGFGGGVNYQKETAEKVDKLEETFRKFAEDEEKRYRAFELRDIEKRNALSKLSGGITEGLIA